MIVRWRVREMDTVEYFWSLRMLDSLIERFAEEGEVPSLLQRIGIVGIGLAEERGWRRGFGGLGLWNERGVVKEDWK